jgi:hypothetical protein
VDGVWEVEVLSEEGNGLETSRDDVVNTLCGREDEVTVVERETTPDDPDCGGAVTDEELVGAETLV